MIKSRLLSVWYWRRRFLLVATIVAGCAFSSPHNAREARANEEAADSVPIVCRDAQGEAVAAAEVYLFQCAKDEGGRYQRFGPFETDMQGRAACPVALFSNDEFGYDRFLYARVPGKLVGVARSAKWKNQKAFNAEGAVRLAPSRSIEGSVSVPEGIDPTQVLVRIDTLHVANGDGMLDYDSFPRQHSFPDVDTALPEIFDCRPDAEGKIAFHDVPERGSLYLLARGEGVGEGQWRNERSTFDEPIAIVLEAEATISGVVISPDGKPAEGIKVTVRRESEAGSRLMVHSSFFATTDERGTFVVGGLAKGPVALFLEDPLARWTFRPREGIKLTPKSEWQEDFTMEEGVLVSGRVADEEGKPVEAAGFSALADSQAAPGLAHTSTDAEGRYSFRLPSGGAQLYFNSLPDGFEYPRPQVVKRLDVLADQPAITDLDFTLRRRSE